MPTPTTPGARLRAAKEAGLKLRAAREELKLSREDVAERLGLSPQSVANAELGLYPISLDKIHELALAIGCDPHSIDPRLASRAPAR